MPTVDSAPQQEDWIDTYLSADAVFSYSDWGGNVIKEQSNNKINYINTASPGVNLDIFKIKDRLSIRSNFNIDKEAIIIGSVMRNQKRKLIPELFASFSNVLKKLKDSDDAVGQNIYLYLHTSYPDMGWDIPELLKEHRLCNKVLFSYICKKCGHVHCSTFSGPNKICNRCMNKTAFMPSVTDGITQDQLSDIYNIFDLYVQYSICEGFGMPQVEAGACGVPIATVDYSAMSDIVNKLNAFAIPIKTKFKELETKASRVYPDNDVLTNYIVDFVHKPKSIRNKQGFETRQLTEKHYCWNNIAKIWENYLDKLYDTYRADWSRPLSMINTNAPKPSVKTNLDKMLSYCSSYYNDASMCGTYKMLNLLKDVDYGFTQNGPTNISAVSSNIIDDFFSTFANNNNISEQVRSANHNFDEDFILYAKMKASTK